MRYIGTNKCMPNSLNSIKMPTILRFFSNDLMNALYLETQLLIIALIIDPLDDAYKSLGILLTLFGVRIGELFDNSICIDMKIPTKIR